MKYLIFSDLHYHRWTRFAEPDSEFLTTRLRRIHDSVMWVRDQILEGNFDIVVMAGDLIHNPKVADYRVYNIMYSDMEAIADACGKTSCEFYILAGNHDMLGRAMNAGTIDLPLTNLPNTRVITEPTHLKKYDVQLLPYSKHTPVPSDAQLTICHMDVLENQIKGHSLGTWSVDDVGTPKVISGHYHVPKRIQGKKCDFVYVGSLLPHSFVDAADTEFGIVVGDLTQEQWCTRMVNPHSIPFCKLTVTDRDAFSKVLDLYPSEAYWRILCAPSDLPFILESLAPSGSIWYEHMPLTDDVSAAVEGMRQNVMEVTDETLVEAYVDKHTPRDCDLDALRKLGVQLMSGTYDREDWVC